MSELLTKLFFGGFVRMHVLYHAVKEPVFGVEMMEELGRHGYDVGAGTLYPMLHQLEDAGYLSVHTEVVAGKQRKYYRATPEGAAALESAKSKLANWSPRSFTINRPNRRSDPTSARGIGASRKP